MALVWTPQMEREFISLLRTDPSPVTQRIENARQALGKRYGVTVTYYAATHKYRRFKDQGVLEGQMPESDPLPEAPTVPLYLDAWTFDEGDGWAIYGDDHGGHVDFALFAMMCEEARNLGISRVLNGGDKWDGSAWSRHAKVVPPVSFEDETSVQRKLRKMADATFTHEYILSGNHDKWIPKMQDGRLGPKDLRRTFLSWLDADPTRVDWSVYGYCTIRSPRLGDIRVTHPKNYSRTPANVAARLAEKYQMHVLTFHEHSVGAKLVRTEKGDKWGVAVGCMADWRGFNYIMLEDSTSPLMRQGFALLKDGLIHIYGEQGYVTTVGAFRPSGQFE